jgi:hypothetical protein
MADATPTLTHIDQRFRHYPKLYSRLGFPHCYRPLGRNDVIKAAAGTLVIGN